VIIAVLQKGVSSSSSIPMRSNIAPSRIYGACERAIRHNLPPTLIDLTKTMYNDVLILKGFKILELLM
jgi:hypothetical protein